MDKRQRHSYRVVWAHHQLSAFNVFNTLMENEKLVDISLYAEGKLLKVHKLVLCACSGYFKNLLSEDYEGDYDRHPTYFLEHISENITFKDVEAIVKFMYKGEVSISQDKLDDFIHLAKALQIRGLAENNCHVELVPVTPHQLTNTKRHLDDEDGSVTKTPGSQKKKKLKRNDDAPTQSQLQTLPSTSANIKMTPDKPNTNAIQSRILLQPITDNNSGPTINKDNSMNMQKYNRVRPNLRRTAILQEIPVSNRAVSGATFSGKATMTPDKPNTNAIQSRILLQPITDNNSGPTINKDNSMNMQKYNRVRPNLRRTAILQEIPVSNRAVSGATFSGKASMTPDKPNTNAIQSRILLQPITDNNSGPTINKDNSMNMQKYIRVRPNLRRTAILQEIPVSNRSILRSTAISQELPATNRAVPKPTFWGRVRLVPLDKLRAENGF